MKKYIPKFGIFCVLLAGGVTFAQPVGDSIIKKAEGFSHPESVVLDERNNVLYISNIGEKTPGDGFISKVSPQGEILDLNGSPILMIPKVCYFTRRIFL